MATSRRKTIYRAPGGAEPPQRVNFMPRQTPPGPFGDLKSYYSAIAAGDAAYEAALEAYDRNEHDRVDRVLKEQQRRASEAAISIDTIRSILRDAGTARRFTFSSLRKFPTYPHCDPDPGAEISPPVKDDFMPPQPTRLSALFGRKEYLKKCAEAELAYQSAMASFETEQNRRKTAQEEKYRIACKFIDKEVEKHNADVDEFRHAYERHDFEAIVDYFSAVFAHDELPAGLPNATRIAFDPDSNQLVIERRLPALIDIPTECGSKYIKKTNSIEAILLKPAERRAIYAEALAQISLRTIRVALAADTAKAFNAIVFNGFADTIDPATGKRTKPTLVSLSVSREILEALSFDHVEPMACLRNLKALVSRNPQELAPVRPLVNFDMVDRRFIDKTDVLSALDDRPNLFELTPNEFESLITNLFEKMGLETRLTQSSRDGGVDCVAWDMRPVIGGKVIVQAKRYRHTVGVSAVRDLFGTMMNEGAAKGILVATSGYGQAAYDFANGKPIELLTGSNLLSLLAEYAQIEALIEFPEDWEDASAQNG